MEALSDSPQPVGEKEVTLTGVTRCKECGTPWPEFCEWYDGPHCPPGRSLANALAVK